MPKTILAVCCLALLAAGCSTGATNSPPTATETADTLLRDVGELYRNYQNNKKKPPGSLTDLVSVRTVGPNGYEAARTGKLVVRYGATLPDLAEDPGQSSSDQVLAYESSVPESGGQVLMLNRTIKSMSADEFKSAPKAGTEPAPKAGGESAPKPASEPAPKAATEK